MTTDQRVAAYAAKLYADGVTFLSGANIMAALSQCVRPPRLGEIDAIRRAYMATYGDGMGGPAEFLTAWLPTPTSDTGDGGLFDLEDGAA